MAQFNDFTKGLTLRAPRIAYERGELAGFAAAQVADNVRVTEAGVSIAPGYTIASSTAFPGPIQGIHRFRRQTAPIYDKILVVAGGHLYTADVGSTTFTQVSGVTLNASARTRFATFGSVCLMTNAVDGLKQYDGTTFSAVSVTNPGTPLFVVGVDNPTIICVKENRVFYSGTATNPYRIYCPAPDTYNNFASNLADAFDVGVGDGFGINGLYATTSGNLIIFKKTNVHVLTGQGPSDSTVSPFSLSTYSRETGLVATDAVQPASTDLFFLSPTGVKQLGYVRDTGGSVYNTLQDTDTLIRIQPVFDAATSDSLANSSLVFNRQLQELYLSLASNTPRDVYTYYIKKKGIARRPGLNIDIQYADADGHYFSRAAAPYYLYKMTPATYTYNGASYTAIWQTKYYDGGDSNLRKAFTHLAVYFATSPSSTTRVILIYRLPDGSTSTETLYPQVAQFNDVWDVGNWGQARWDAVANVVIQKARLLKANAIAIRLETDSLSGLSFDGIDVQVQARGFKNR